MSEQILKLETREKLRPTGHFDSWVKSVVLGRLEGLQFGELTLVDGTETQRFGDPGSGPRATLIVHDPRVYRALLTRGPMGGAETFIDGLWSASDLTAVIRILAANRDVLAGLNAGLARLAKPSIRLYHALRRNSITGSRRNIGAHYDLGNEFFELFLDPTLTYSSGIFDADDSSMEEASIAKYDRVCKKLHLSPSDRVLEIGTGWGGFAIHAAGNYGCRVTTTTISRRQYELADARIREHGLEHLIDLRLEDYRDLEGSYDKLVSIEMIEAVGAEHLDTFFRVCAERLSPDGVMCIQAITHRDQDYQRSLESVDFIKRYIFPGGQLVSNGALVSAATRTSDMRLTHLEDITPHYAETLQRWRQQMGRNLEGIRALGVSDRFLRMWKFYLCYCEGGFLERSIGTVQVVFERQRARRPSILGRLDDVGRQARVQSA
jgi:cyclopropane-fatty-acyl-phospholipid synthase